MSRYRLNPKANGEPTRAEKKLLNRAKAAAERAGRGRSSAPKVAHSRDGGRGTDFYASLWNQPSSAPKLTRQDMSKIIAACNSSDDEVQDVKVSFGTVQVVYAGRYADPDVLFRGRRIASVPEGT